LSVRPCANRSTGKEVNMRNRFDRQLVQLNNELIEMGGMIEKAISDTVKALVKLSYLVLGCIYISCSTNLRMMSLLQM
jgi:hypothetical protein